MRQPTTQADALAWWREAWPRVAAGERVPVYESEVHCGFYKTRLVARGPWVPARIWLEQDICPETGELLGEEILRCEIGGEQHDPFDKWTWLAGKPISRAEYDDLCEIAGALTA